jgi:hypothetical protein
MHTCYQRDLAIELAPWIFRRLLYSESIGTKQTGVGIPTPVPRLKERAENFPRFDQFGRMAPAKCDRQ